MKHLLSVLLIAWLITITALAIWLVVMAWDHLPQPLPAVACLHIAALWFGGLFLGVIQFAKYKLDP
jgi:hypothetical protein